jgi:hypothetical protein
MTHSIPAITQPGTDHTVDQDLVAQPPAQLRLVHDD